MNDSPLLDNVNNILQYLHDSFNGYQLNLEDVSDPRLKVVLEKICLNRSAMIEEIKSFITESGGIPKEQGTVKGKFHHWFQDIKNAITDGDVLSVSRQIRLGESTLIDEYKNLLNENLPDDIRQLLLNQLSQIEDDLKEVEMESAKT